MTARRLVAALALALPVPAAAHPFAPRHRLSLGSATVATVPLSPTPATSVSTTISPATPVPTTTSSPTPVPTTASPATPAPATPSPASAPPVPATTSPAPDQPVPATISTASDLSPPASPPVVRGEPVPSTAAVAPPVVRGVPAPEPAPRTPLPPHPMFVRPAIDIPIIALGAAISLGTYVAGRDLRWSGCGACDPAAINALDRRVLGNADRTAAAASNVLVFSAIAVPFVADLGDALAGSRARPGGTRHAAGGWLRDAVVLTEVLTVNLALADIVKYAVRRPRPYSYDPDNPLADVTDNQARLSFYSQHTSNAFAMLTAYAMLFTLRHPRSRALAPVWLAAVGLAATTGVLRVVSGKHFWTDVLTGAFAGAAVGVLVPAAHATRWRHLTPGLSRTPGGALVTLGGRF